MKKFFVVLMASLMLFAFVSCTEEIHKHELEKVEAVAATCTEDGCEEYYKCKGCGKLFSDPEGTTEVSMDKLVIKAGHSFDSETGKCSVCGAYLVSTEEQLEGAIADAECKIITLNSDFNLSVEETIQITKDITVELNSKLLKLSTSGATALEIIDGANVTIKGGSLEVFCGKASLNTAISVEKGILNIEKVTYTTDMCAALPSNDSSVIVKNSEIRSSGYYGLSTNNTYGTPPQIEVYDSSVEVKNDEKDNTAILMNGGGNVIIKNSNITADRQCVIIRGGSATITDSELIKISDYTVNNRYDGNYGTGNEVAEAVVFVGSDKASVYEYDSVVSISKTSVSTPKEYTGEVIHVSGRPTYKAELTASDLTGTVCKVFMHAAGTVTINGKEVTETSDVTL